MKKTKGTIKKCIYIFILFFFLVYPLSIKMWGENVFKISNRNFSQVGLHAKILYKKLLGTLKE